MRNKYNIKYIQKPGNKTKTPLYEIAPGTWVTRGHTPERKNWKKKWDNKPVNAVKNNAKWADQYYVENREKILIKKLDKEEKITKNMYKK